MRRPNLRRVPVGLAALALAGTAVPGLAADERSPLVQVDLGPGPFISENVDYLGTLPVAPGIGGRVLMVGKQQRLYMTGSQGLFIFDVTNPALPTPLGVYHLPHFQNEDVDVSDDGKRVIISTDTAGADRSGSVANGIHVLDTSNPADIKRVGFIADGNHTTTCADAKCEWLYGSDGTIFDATKVTDIKLVGRWRPGTSGGGHALNKDETGLMISDSTPRYVLDPRTNPAKPTVLAQGSPTVALPDGLLQHNNVRLRAAEWQPREVGDVATDIRPGEMFIGNAESNLRPQCGANAGGLSSWSMANFDKGAPLKQLEVFRPVNGTYANGNPAVNALGCSGHWFTVRNGMVAASWYEHGVRFIAVDEKTGKFTEKGYFQPVATEAGAAHWLTDAQGNEYVYSMDYARGIDILRFRRGAPAASQDEITKSWLAGLEKAAGPMAELERALCRQASHHVA